MSWRGKQPQADIDRAVAQAEYVAREFRRPEAKHYTCRVCGWVECQDGCGYDSLLDVCPTCARRISNLHHKKHSGEWLFHHWATQEDFAYFYESPHALPVARAKNAKAKIKNALRLKVYERDGFKCVYCGSRKELSLDHVRAESRGGSSEEGNLVTACRPCNTRKRDKSLSDFWETIS